MLENAGTYQKYQNLPKNTIKIGLKCQVRKSAGISGIKRENSMFRNMRILVTPFRHHCLNPLHVPSLQYEAEAGGGLHCPRHLEAMLCFRRITRLNQNSLFMPASGLKAFPQATICLSYLLLYIITSATKTR